MSVGAVDADARAEKQRFRTFASELELILWAVWNPIPGVPIDEYANYVPAVWSLLAQGAGSEAIATELRRITVEAIGMEGSSERDRETAERLKEWWYWRFAFPEELEAASQLSRSRLPASGRVPRRLAVIEGPQMRTPPDDDHRVDAKAVVGARPANRVICAAPQS